MSFILDQKINTEEIISQFEDKNSGATVIFRGTVRKQSFGKEVSHLFYEVAENLAEKMIQQIIEEAQLRWELCGVIAFHRVGEVPVGDCAVLVLTASKHRKEAYEANRFLIEKIKHEIPIWKCEYFTDGEKKWGGNCNCHEVTGDPNKHLYIDD